MKNHLYSLRIDLPLTAPLKILLSTLFKSLGVKKWLLGNTEYKKDSNKEHFHGIFYSSYSENKVKKEFKHHLSSLPIWDDTNNYSCCMKKKEGKCIMINSKKYKHDIERIISYPIKTVKSLDAWLSLKDYRGIPKQYIIEKYTDRLKSESKKEIMTKKKTKNDYTIIWENILTYNLHEYPWDKYRDVVHVVSKCILEHYSTLDKKAPYRNYLLSMINSYLLKLNWHEYKQYYEDSLSNEFIETHKSYFTYNDAMTSCSKPIDFPETQFKLEFN